MSVAAGSLIGGRYRLDAVIGHGGMSTVYRALDTVLERPVAIKVLNREIASDEQQLERFRREARAVAQLSHPHVVTVIDAGEDAEDPDGSTPYIVFELVEGETLKARIRRMGKLPVSESVAYAIEIARALGAAHERQIVHRDVKPQNVLVDEDGTAKIGDFGIARTMSEEALTAHGRVLGTTDYVSPEQALGHPVSGQSDLYSLGVVLYEMLTGEVPFRGDSAVAVAMRHVREELPDVQQRRPGVSAALAAVVDRATAKDLSRRYPDASTMARDLEDVLAIEVARSGETPTGETTSVLRSLPTRSARRIPLGLRHPVWRWLAVLLVVVAIVVAVVLIAQNAHRGTSSPPTVVVPPHLREVHLAQNSAHDFDPFGDGHENHGSVGFAVDGDPTTAWSTERYYDYKLGKPGVGIYLDASPGVAAKKIELQTSTPGFAVAIYGAQHAPPAVAAPVSDGRSLQQLGWSGPLGGDASVRSGARLALNIGVQRYRYYLVWIEKLPPRQQSVSISDITLLH